MKNIATEPFLTIFTIFSQKFPLFTPPQKIFWGGQKTFYYFSRVPWYVCHVSLTGCQFATIFRFYTFLWKMVCISPIGSHVKLNTGPMGKLQTAGSTLKTIFKVFFSTNMSSIRPMASEYTTPDVSLQKKCSWLHPYYGTLWATRTTLFKRII